MPNELTISVWVSLSTRQFSTLAPTNASQERHKIIGSKVGTTSILKLKWNRLLPKNYSSHTEQHAKRIVLNLIFCIILISWATSVTWGEPPHCPITARPNYPLTEINTILSYDRPVNHLFDSPWQVISIVSKQTACEPRSIDAEWCKIYDKLVDHRKKSKIIRVFTFNLQFTVFTRQENSIRRVLSSNWKTFPGMLR